MRSTKRLSVLVLFFGILFLLAHNTAHAATTYYSQCTGCDPNTLTNWNSIRAGGGSSPGNFTTGDGFVIQNGHSMTNTSAWAVSGTGNKIQIENGGTLTAGALVSCTVFQIDNGGNYVVAYANGANGAAADIPGSSAANRVFGASSTVEIQKWGDGTGTPVALPSSISWGNITINITTAMANSWQQAGNVTTINGNLTVKSLGSSTQRAFRFVSGSPSSLTVNIAGDVIISGGILDLVSGSSTATFNVGGNLNQTGGTFDSSGSGVTTIVFTSGSSSVTFAKSAGTLTSTNINWQIANGKTVTFNNAFTIAASRSMTVDSGGTLATAAGITNSGTFTVNGTLQINSGGFVSGTAPTYATTALLKYNSGGTYGRGTEWNSTSGAGYPGNVQLGNNTTLDLGANSGTGIARQIAGSLTIDGGSTLEMAGTNAMSAALTVLGDVTNNGTLRLSTTNGGDIKVAGNWTRGSSGTFTPNNRAVFFNGTGTQILSVTGSGTETFNYLLIDKTTGNVQLNSSPATDGAVNGTSGNALQLLNTGGIDLNGRTLTMSGSGGNLLVSGGARTITGTSGSTFSFTGAKTVTFASGGTLTFDDNVLVKISAGVGFNNSTTTIKNILQIDSSGFVTSGSAPTYGAASTLKYNSGASYGANEEWYPNTTSGAGVPQNVQVSNNTALNLGSTTFARTMKGTLTIDPGASLTLSSGSGGNLNVAGDFANSGTFTHNSRTVIFNGSGTQNLTANNPTTFNNLTVNTGVTLVETVSAENVSVSSTLTNNGTIRKSQSVNGTGAKTFGLAGSFNAANLTIDVTTQGSLSNLRVDRVDSNHPNAGTPQQTGRYWSITPTNSGYSANLTLPRNNAGMPSVCRYSGSGTLWNCASAGSTSNTVTGNGITSFSDWAVGNDAPTAAELIRFKAKLTLKNKVQVRWKTGAELKILGFNLYRQGGGQKGWVKVNAKQIDAIHLGTPEGALYKFTDNKVQPGKTYRYKLEIITLSGSEWSDPVKIAVP